MSAPAIRHRISFLIAMLAIIFAITTGLLNGLAVHAWLLDAPSTDVSGEITSDTTWTLAGSPYVMTETVTVAAGITLTVEPGVVVMGERYLWIQGHLEAVGTAANPITFTSVANTGPGEWDGIYFEGGTGHLGHTSVRFAGENDFASITIGPLFDDVADGPVTIENSIIHDNLAYPVMVGPGSLHQFKLNQVSFANNGQNRVAINGDEPFIADVTLTNNPGLEAYELVEIWSKLIVPKGITLTLEPGVTLLANDMPAPIQVSGHVEAVGTAVSPITLTANTGLGMSERVPFSIEGSAHLDHVLTGGNLNVGVWGTDGGPVLIENSTLSGSTFYPLYVGNNALHRLQMTNVTFTDNITNRVLIEPVANNGVLADSARLTAQPGLEGYQIMPILPESVPNLVVPGGLTLTVNPGVTLMGVNSGNLVVEGHLLAEGTAVSPITFTSITNTLPGEWGGLTISGTASLDHTIIRYGENNLGVINGAGEVSIANSEIGQSSDTGLYVSGGQVTAVCTTFANNNSDAVYVTGSPDVRLLSSSLTGNGSGVNSEGSTVVDARQNWWGDASGPAGIGPGSGDAVSGNVMYDPWLTEPTCTLTPYQLYIPLVIKQ